MIETDLWELEGWLMELLAGIPVGLVRRTRGRTVSQKEVRLFQELTGSQDEPHAASFVLAMMSGLRDSGSIPHGIMVTHHFNVVAALSAVADFLQPLSDGDTICVETHLLNARASQSRPGRGVMEVEERCLNQREEVLVKRQRAFLFERTSPGAG